MTAKEEISKTLWRLRSRFLDQVEAEAIIFPILDSLVAEGAEQERERIRHWIEYDAPISDDGVPYHDLLSYLTPKGAFHATQKEIDGEIESERKKYAALDASVLAPTKEGDK